jgi:hypothetical protein
MERIDDRDQAIAALKSGQAWVTFCQELAEAAKDLQNPGAPTTPLDVAESYRYLARMVRCAFEQIVEGGDARMPAFFDVLRQDVKSGWDNPDNTHSTAYISGANSYRVSGVRGDSHYMTLAVYGGSLGRDGGRRTVAYVDIDTLTIGADGRFEIFLGKTPQHGNWIETADDATTLMVRQTFWDKSTEKHAELYIECLDADPAPLDPVFLYNALRRSIRFIRGTNKVFFDNANEWRPHPNVFFPGKEGRAEETIGIPNMTYSSGCWELGEDEALEIELNPPRCRYWGLALCNYWGESLDYERWNVHTNAKRANVRPDGSARVIMAHRDPKLADATWLDVAGHTNGVWTLRWLEADSKPLPKANLVPFDSLRQETPDE